jgi:hypothetical protein
VTLRTIALELVPSNVEHGTQRAVDDAHPVLDRPVEMKPKLDVLEFWSAVTPELPGVHGLCTQVTAFTAEPALRERLTDLCSAGIDGIIFVGVPRTMNDGEGSGVAPTDALSLYDRLVDNRGVILIPTRAGEQGRFTFKCRQGATFAMTQLLYSDAIVGFLTDFAAHTEHRPEILLSFGFVPKFENKVGLINWLIQDAGNDVVADEQAMVRKLADSGPERKRKLMLDLYRRVIDGVADLGYPLSVHLEAPYGVSAPAFDTFAEMLAYWAPEKIDTDQN